MTIAEMEQEVLTKISIPDYVYQIVLPNMQEYYNGDYEVNFEVSRYMKCCFHNEDSPSLRWYEETNTYYCFGCGKGGKGPNGTIIGFHINFAERMNGKKPSRNEAIIFLYRYFLEGKDTRNVFVDVSVKKSQNSETELAQLSIYKNDIERAVTYDSSIKMEKKIDFYDMLDNIDMFLFKDIISANEARRKIESAVEQLVK